MTVPPVPVRAPVRLGREGVRHECLRKNSCYAPLGRQSYESVWPFAFVMVVVRNEPFVTGSLGVEPHARRGLGVDEFCTVGLRELSISFERAIPPANDQGGTGMAEDNITLMAGDATRVAGRHRDELGVHSVRVLRVDIDGR